MKNSILRCCGGHLSHLFVGKAESARTMDSRTEPVLLSQGRLTHRSRWRAANLQSEKAKHPARTKTLSLTQSNFLPILLM